MLEPADKHFPVGIRSPSPTRRSGIGASSTLHMHGSHYTLRAGRAILTRVRADGYAIGDSAGRRWSLSITPFRALFASSSMRKVEGVHGR